MKANKNANKQPLLSKPKILWLFFAYPFAQFLIFLQYPLLSLLMIAFYGITITVICLGMTYGIPSMRTCVPIFYLIMFSIIPTWEQMAGINNYAKIAGLDQALILASIGILFFGIGVIYFEKFLSNFHIQPLVNQWPLSAMNSLFGVVTSLIVGIAAALWSLIYGYFGLNSYSSDISSNPSSIAGIISTASVLLEVATITCWIAYYGKYKPKQKALYLGIIGLVVMLFISLFANSKGAIIKPLIAISIAYLSVKKYFPLKIIGAAILIYIFIAYPWITAMRISTNQALYRGYSRTELLEKTFKKIPSIVAQQYELNSEKSINNESKDGKVISSIGRGLLPLFAKIVTITGERHGTNFLHGETYSWGISTIVPRSIWPDKPSANIANLVGRKYGILPPYDKITNISPTQLGEIYMNYGDTGLCLGMFLWGVFAVSLDKILCGKCESPLSSWLFSNIFWQEGVFGQTLIPFFKTIVFLCIWSAILSLIIEQFNAKKHPQHKK